MKDEENQSNCAYPREIKWLLSFAKLNSVSILYMRKIFVYSEFDFSNQLLNSSVSWVNCVLHTKGFNSINVTFVSNQTFAFSQPFKIDADYSLNTFKGTFLFYRDKQSGITFYHLNNHSCTYPFYLRYA